MLNSRNRVALLALSAMFFTCAGIYIAQHRYFISMTLMLTGIIFLVLADRISAAVNEAIRVFFDSLRNDDTTIKFPENFRNKRLSRLFESMNDLNAYFREIRVKNELNEAYYRTLIHNASAGLLVLGENNKLELINKTACNYAGISHESTNADLLKIKYPAFYEAVCSLKPGQNVTYKNIVDGNLQLLSFRATMIKRNDEQLKLVSIQDIRTELESRELESYRKLLNVMTHEIMNQLSPLTAVAKELHDMVEKTDRKDEVSEGESLKKITINGLKLINEQSAGLVNFMSNYRKLSKIPAPEFSSFDAEEWIHQLRIAFTGKMNENNIEFKVSADKSLKEIIGDRKLLNQVMVNLINNAIDAVMEKEGERCINIVMIKNSENRAAIRVINNGPVIPYELLEKIFVPFFTMKKNGSGIGLSISQEIMKMHNGSINAISNTFETCFLVEF